MKTPMILLANSAAPLEVCQHACRFCGALVLVCHTHRLVMHVEPRCLPFAEAMARSGLPDPVHVGAVFIDVDDEPDPLSIN